MIVEEKNQPEFHLPEGLNYQCVQCGKSCRMFEEVFVEERSEERLRGLEYRELMAEEARGLDPLVPGKSDPAKKRLRWSCGTCVFQREDGLCGIHARYDFEAKPQTCQDFPYRFTETPRGVFVGMSFACTSVLANSGKPLVEQEEYARRMFPLANGRRDVRSAVALTHRHAISWEAYEGIECGLREILRVETETLGMRLVAQAVYIDLVERMIREMRQAGQTAPDSGAIEDRRIVDAVAKRYLADEGKGLFAIARRMKASPALQRAFIGLVTAFRQNLYEKEKRPTRVGSVARIVAHYVSHMFRAGQVNLIPMETRFGYGEFKKYQFSDGADEETERMLVRYFDHSLFRKDLLAAESVWLAQRMTLMHYALVRWYAVGHASARGLEKIDMECVHEAVRAVELNYLFHTKFGELFQKFPSLGMVLDGIVRKPSFAASMAGEVV